MPLSVEQLSHAFSGSGQTFNLQELLLAARNSDLKVKVVHTTLPRLDHTPLPAIAIGHNGQFFILAKWDHEQALIQDPHSMRPGVIRVEALEQRWSGDLILVRPRHGLSGGVSRFDFTWFIPAIVKYRKLLGEVLLGSFALQLFALVTPLFFQVVMDKILVHHGLTTLDVIATGLHLIHLPLAYFQARRVDEITVE